ncbi:hypothetical protein DRE_03922 [Drechslerella stenobrocha 248]|uniref:SP-RING-type domain-containing protein n=1 Tax=Drechslerella stenobrocha 248 TaxID=1043628 RepID=W7ICQ7_9PEZI|nr:hypothetical protein DRE_03922 [Drechslerella stenobrocha 248]
MATRRNARQPERKAAVRPEHTPAQLPIHTKHTGELRALHAKYPPANIPRLLKGAIDALRDASKDFALNRKEFILDQEGKERNAATEQEVAELGRQVEKNVRSLVDLDEEIKTMKRVLQEIGDADRNRGDGPGVQPVGEYVKRTKMARRAYMRKDLKERYGNVADYVDFRTIVHGVSDPTAPVPQRKDWFKKPLFICDAVAADMTDDEPISGSDGELAGSDVEMQGGDGSDDDSDDDIQEMAATRDLKCPLTMRRFVEPVKSAVCGHVFEKDAIVRILKEYKQHKKPAICPTTGCGRPIKVSDLSLDVVTKSLVEAQIKSEEQRARRAAMERGARSEQVVKQEKGKEEEEEQSRSRSKRPKQSAAQEDEIPYGDEEGVAANNTQADSGEDDEETSEGTDEGDGGSDQMDEDDEEEEEETGRRRRLR